MHKLFPLVLLLLLPLTYFATNHSDLVTVNQQLFECPVVNPPTSLRQSNWFGSNRTGSCCHAALITALHWQGETELAAWWRNNHGDGETPASMKHKLGKSGVTFSQTFGQKDVSFLQKACLTRRGAMVAVRNRTHMVFLAHFGDSWVGIIDNNSPTKMIWRSRKEFLADWFSSDSWAITPIYSPVPPRIYSGD